MIRFLCGCTSAIEIPIFPGNASEYPATAEDVERYLSTFDGISFDDEGFIQCSLHHQRRYGWRTPSHTAKFGGMTDYEYERLVVWGEQRVRPKVVEITRNGHHVPDLRPHIYEGMLDEKARLAIRNADTRWNFGADNRASRLEADALLTHRIPYCDEARDSSHSSAAGLDSR